MQSLVVRYTKDVTFHQAYVVNVPFEYESVEKFLVDYLKWCTATGVSEHGFKNLGVQSHHGPTVEVLTLEEWFWKYKRQ